MATRRPGATATPAEDTVSVIEAARHLNLHKSRAYELIKLGRFPVPAAELVRNGDGHVRVPVAALERALGQRPPLAPELAPKDRAALLEGLRRALPEALAAVLPDALVALLREMRDAEAAR